MRNFNTTTAKPQRECKDPSILLWIRSENAFFFAGETIETQKKKLFFNASETLETHKL